MATSYTSVEMVSGPHANHRELDAHIRELSRNHPGAIIERYLGHSPSVGNRVMLAAGCALVGNVTLGDDVSIWYGAVLRGDIAAISVGARSNVQDGSVLHVGDESPCVVQEDVVIGHRAMLHGCLIESNSLIGMQSTILDDVVVGSGSIVGAGALVLQRTEIPPCSLVLGSPAKVVKDLGSRSPSEIKELASKYLRVKENYLRDSLATARSAP